MNTKVVFDEKKKAYAAYDNGKLLGYYRTEADAKDAIEFNRTTARLSAICDREMLGAFNADQIQKLRDEYGKIDGIDPSMPTYKKLTDLLDKMDDEMLIQVAEAGIKFVSPLARNRVSRRGLKLSAICDRELQRVGLAGDNEETMEDPQDVRDSQVIVPDWMEKILSDAESKGRKVRVVRKHTAFGSYVMALKVA